MYKVLVKKIRHVRSKLVGPSVFYAVCVLGGDLPVESLPKGTEIR
jgi:hypothetical protein